MSNNKDDKEVLKNILHKLIKGTDTKSIVYEAIERDDDSTLNMLVDAGYKFDVKDNFVFSAVDLKAKKCLDVLLKNGASITASGRTMVSGDFTNLEPLELACLTNQIDVAEKLVQNGASLKTVYGKNILVKYVKYISKDEGDVLKRLHREYLQAHNNDLDIKM